MFVDASALCAILFEEEDARDLISRIEAAERRFTSPIAIYETVLAVTRMHDRSPADAESKVRAFLRRAGISVEAIGDGATTPALDAHARFGKGRHPARLNLGDCFAYAMAKQHGVPILYKGDDFAQTDLA